MATIVENTTVLESTTGVQIASQDPEEDSITYYTNIQDRIYTYGPPIIVILGTIGNGLILLVLLGRSSLRAHTTTVYLAALAITDTIILYTGILRYWIRTLFDVDVRSLTNAGCKVHIFVLYWSVHFEAWVLVNMTMERLLAVILPHKVKLIVTRSRIYKGLILTGVVCLALDLHLFFTNYMKPETDSDGSVLYRYCAYKEGFEDFFVIWPWIDLSFASVAPFLIIILSNIVIVVTILFRRYQCKIKMTSSSTNKIGGMTAILMAVSLTFLLLTLPICVFLGTEELLYQDASDVTMAKLDTIFAAVNIIYYTNCSVNFLLYCVTGARFRREFLKLFGCYKDEQVQTVMSTLSVTQSNNESEDKEKQGR